MEGATRLIHKQIGGRSHIKCVCIVYDKNNSGMPNVSVYGCIIA